MTLALLITAVTGAWADGDTKYTVTFKANGNTKTVENVTLPKTFELDPIIRELYPSLSGGSGSPAGTSASGNTNVTAYHNNSKHYATISAPFEGVVTVTGQFFKDFTNYQYTLEINCMENLVAISDDKTEATMESMPTYDVNFNYELVRDMSVQMTTEIGDGKDGYRIRLQKNEQTGKYEPAEMTAQQMKELVKVHDAIENYDLTFGVLGANCIVNIYEANDENQAVGEPIAFADLTPGRYIAKAVAATGSAYEGETGMSNTFVLFEGYEVTVPAGEYVTYYKDEALYVEDENAQLYTITAVSGTTATATELTVAPANTPLLVKNNAAETKTILLIPTTTDTPDNVEVYSGFKGTLEATQIAGSTDTQANYVCTGKQFTWVKDAGTIAANRCWLELVSSTGAPVLDIVFDGNATGIETTKFTDDANDAWYDLNGRRLQAKPTTKGVYILNGRKVVVK